MRLTNPNKGSSIFPFGMLFNDSSANGYSFIIDHVHLTTDANFQGDGHVAAADIPVPRAGTARRLYIKPSVNTLDGNLVFTVYKNGSATALTVTVAAGVTTINSDTTHSVSFAPGDVISIGTDTTTSTVGNWRIMGSLEFA